MDGRSRFAVLLVVSALLAGCNANTGWEGAKSVSTSESSHGGKGDTPTAKPPIALMNVSYDPTRELYADFNEAFAKHWQKTAQQEVRIEQTHGPSGAQARAVIDGLRADVVTLAIAYDIDQIAKLTQALPADWQKQFGHNSSPYQSTVVFLVRKGNPKGIKDWSDLVKPGVEVITANPKVSGAGRLAYLAAWGYALKKNNNDEAKATKYITALYKNVPVLDSGARASTTTFVQRGIGDVLLAWENEAFLAIRENKDAAHGVAMVVPSISILAEPPVAVVSENAEKRGTTEVAKAYLNYLYSPEGQSIAAKHFYRPSDPSKVDAAIRNQFPELTLFSVNDVFGSWRDAHEKHFKDGGTFDSIYAPE